VGSQTELRHGRRSGSRGHGGGPKAQDQARQRLPFPFVVAAAAHPELNHVLAAFGLRQQTAPDESVQNGGQAQRHVGDPSLQDRI